MSTTRILIAVVLAGLSVLAIFVVPHHVYPEHTYKPRTLWGIVAPVFGGDLPNRPGPLAVLLACLVLGAFSALFPVAVVPVLHSSLVMEAGSFELSHRPWLIGAGVVALLGTAVNALAILVSELSFGFGTSSAAANRTVGFVAVPLFQGAVALVTVVIGAFPSAAGLVCRFFTP